MATNSSSLSLSDKIAFYKKEIRNIADTSFNKQQKKLCLDILDKATEENIDKIYQFITQRVKTGFVFDIAPEVQHDCIALIEKDKKLSFESNALGEKLTHKLIIGENYDALKNLLAVYENKVDFIYIDPPYNTESTRTDGNSLTDIEGQNTGKFIYRDKFSRTGWLNMMNERLQLARKLLSDKGVIFISIDDNEQAYLKVLCDDVFGEENFVSSIPRVTKKGGKSTDAVAKNHDYIVIYTKQMNKGLSGVLHDDEGFCNKDEYFETRGYYKLNQTLDYDSLGYVKSLDYPIEIDGEIFYAGGDKEAHEARQKGEHERADWTWRWRWKLFNFGYKNGFIEVKRTGKRPRIYTKTYQKCTIEEKDGEYKIVYFDRTKPLSTLEFINNVYSNDNASKNIANIFPLRVFEYSKPTSLIKKILEIASQKNSICLDFFAGSGTTGQAVMELNEEDGGKRQFILCTNNENGIAENITYERLYRVINGEGTKGEQFKWQYSKDKKSLKNNNLDVFRINYHHLEIEDYEKGEKLIEQAKEAFKQLDDDFELKSEFDIYNKLASLKPYSEADRAECEKGFSYQNKQAEEVENEEEQD